eukprot:Pompholyxophrys_punicea_v1_NODE_1072_length_989_cov_3.204497.p3 type:complete len:100 gc:universal NODE_1072_length_989_cov_3.204497:45-344(+)
MYNTNTLFFTGVSFFQLSSCNKTRKVRNYRMATFQQYSRQRIQRWRVDKPRANASSSIGRLNTFRSFITDGVAWQIKHEVLCVSVTCPPTFPSTIVITK